ncbi:general transcription factor 3C polypeptide 6 isoform X2 [Erinaceus europaeus]|uniref:General transcription factor 3C polypeptide 6 isoform X2 n=1 Tax=Erinaceus europaeus TaxID=9365 RepID=A0ABM3XCR4_ERIEU|nr:general transcription factor 3C polypeptide 6 isoform X2 [Erinaceus europaeus]
MAAREERSLGDGEEEEEVEQLVLVELSGIIDSDFLSKCEKKCKILGIDTERPILQLDSYVFAGEYEDALGTCVIFEEDVDHDEREGDIIHPYSTIQGTPPDAVVLPSGAMIPNQSFMHVDLDGGNRTVLKYKCHTVKKLGMTRTLLTEKKEGEESIGNVEWLQIKDNDFSCRPNMICSFVHENENENEDEEVVPPASEKPLELEEPESQGKENSSLIYEQEEGPDLEMEDSEPVIALPSSETDTSIFMEAQDSDLDITPR